MDNIVELYKLNELYNLFENKNDKRTIKRLIKKRNLPFTINYNLKFTDKELGQGKMTVNKIYNKLVGYEGRISYHDKRHWLLSNKEYHHLIYLKRQSFSELNSEIYKETSALINIYIEEELIKIINKQFNL